MKAVLWLSVLTFQAGVSAKDSQVLANLLKAKYALSIKEYQDALVFINQARLLDPFEPESYFLEIQVAGEQLKANSASRPDLENHLLDLHGRAMALFPKDYRFYMSLGKFLSTGQRWTRAPHFEKPGIYLSQAITLMEQTDAIPEWEKYETRYQLGLWYFAEENHFEASEQLVEVCNSETAQPWALYYAAQTLEGSGQFQAAMAFLEEYQNRGLRDIGANRRPMNLSLEIMKQIVTPHPTQLESLLRAIEAEGGTSYLYYDTALRFYRLERRDVAIEILKKLMSKEILDSQSLSLLLRCQLESHLYRDVMTGAAQALNGGLDPRTRRVWIDYAAEAAFLVGDSEYLGDLHRTYGSLDEVAERLMLLRAFQNVLKAGEQEMLEEYLRESKSSAFAAFFKVEMEKKGTRIAVLENAVQFFQARMDWLGGIRLLEQEIAKDQPPPHLWDDLADSFALAGNYEEAFEWYEKVLIKEPNRADMLNNFGYFLTLAGKDFDRAKAMIKQAVALEPGSAAYLDSLGWVCFAQGDYLSAESYLLKALRIDPHHPEKVDHLGDVHFRLGNTRKARELWSKALQHLQDQNYNLGEKRISEIIQKLASDMSEPAGGNP